MADFEILYHKMLLASNKALEIIQKAQFECENMYVEMIENEKDAFKREYSEIEIIKPDTSNEDFINIDRNE